MKRVDKIEKSFYYEVMKKLFLLPGLDGSGVILQKLSENLKRLGFDTYVISYPHNQQWKYEDYARFVEQYIGEKIEPQERFAVFAESFGGPIVPLIYRKFKNQINKIVFCASFVTNPVIGATALKLFNKYVKPSSIPSLAYAVNFIGVNPDAETLQVFTKCKEGLSDSLVRARVNEVLSLSNNSPQLQEFSGISTPILYIQAKYDTVVLPRGYTGLKRLNPHTQLKVIDSAHLVSHAKSREVAETMFYFLENIQ